jgi:alpha-glucuronidase
MNGAVSRVLLLWFVLAPHYLPVARAEDGYELWLRYRLEQDEARRLEYKQYCGAGIVARDRPVIKAAAAEIERALPAILGGEFQPEKGNGGIYIGIRADNPVIAGLVRENELAALGDEGFAIRAKTWRARPVVVVTANTDHGVLHGTFALLRALQLGTPLGDFECFDAPKIKHRLANHWDNPAGNDGFRGESIERGYAGGTIFNWAELPGRIDPRLQDWARLLAAMGLNGVAVNNVNTAKRGLEGWRLLAPAYLPKLAALAGVLRPYGIRLYISVNFFSPVLIDSLSTADPVDPGVRQWWSGKAAEIYNVIPDFGGFVVKADSEGEPGPLKYGRTHADGANMIAAALAPHGGNVYWRAFVYNREKGDRVTQAFGHFQPLDGAFAGNVFLQVKNGPLDFQVREPVSPLFGAMPRTPLALELQITQEYTGQDKHVCFLAPMWSEVLGFAPRGKASGGRVGNTVAAVAGVMNIGDARNWTGHLLAQANTYAFGRQAWNPEASPKEIAGGWIRLTFGRDPQVAAAVERILLDSRRVYENYTAPYGLGLLGIRGTHFEPDPANRADYHGANARGVGIDRTVAAGTGFAGQYFEPWRSLYERPETCPEDLLLFFHHAPYTFRLHDGATLIQSIYDRHFAGVASARGFLAGWETLRGRMDDERFEHVRLRLSGQIGHAEGWCRSINDYFRQRSGIADEQNRALP